MVIVKSKHNYVIILQALHDLLSHNKFLMLLQHLQTWYDALNAVISPLLLII